MCVCMCTCVPAYICVFDILMSYIFALTSNLLKSPSEQPCPRPLFLLTPFCVLVHERHTKLSKAIWTPIGLQGIVLPGLAPSVAIGLLAAGGVRLQQERSSRLARRGCSDQLIITWGSCLKIDGPSFWPQREERLPFLCPAGPLHSLSVILLLFFFN